MSVHESVKGALDEVLADPEVLRHTVTLELDIASLLAVFAAAHLGIRHPGLEGGDITDMVVGLTHHVAAEVAAADPRLEPLAKVLIAGLDPTHDQ